MALFQKPEEKSEQKPVMEILPQTPLPTTKRSPLFKQAADMGVSMLRSIPRSAISATLSLFGRDKLDPETKVEKVILGQEPIGNLHNEGAKTLKMFGANEENQQKYGTIFGMGLAMADLTPGIPGKKKVVKEVAEKVAGKIGKEVLKEAQPILKGQKLEGFKTIIDKTKPMFYHFTDKTNAQSLIEKGWNPKLTQVNPENPDQWWASTSRYGDYGGSYGNTIVGFYPKEPIKILEIGSQDYLKFSKEGDIRMLAKKEGYDVIMGPKGVEEEVLSPEKFTFKQEDINKVYNENSLTNFKNIDKKTTNILQNKLQKKAESKVEKIILGQEPTILKGQTLIKEARKYKTAEEFVRAQGTPVYHGTFKPKGMQFDQKGILYTSTKTGASSYGSGRVEEFYKSPGKTLVIKKEMMPNDWDKVIANAKKDGFDYVKGMGTDFYGNKVPVLISINSEKSLKTRSQLTDIWKEAQGEAFGKAKLGTILGVTGATVAGLGAKKLFGSKEFTVENKEKKSIFKEKPLAEKITSMIGAHETKFIPDKSGKLIPPKNEMERYKSMHTNGAIGFYGVERDTLDTYENEIFGRHITTEEFRNSKELQDKFALELNKMRLAQGMTEDEVIQAWNQGPNGIGNKKAKKYLQNVKPSQSRILK